MSDFDPKKYHGLGLQEVLDLAGKAVGQGTDSLKEAQSIYRLCLQQNIPLYLKGRVRRSLWNVEKRLGQHGLYFSQGGQDRFLHERLFNHKRNGTFVEIGAFNGWLGSNCLFFEKMLGWTGLIVEASPRLVGQISETRNSQVVHAAISDTDGVAGFVDIESGLLQMSGIIDHYSPQRLSRVRKDPRHAENIVEVPSMRLSTLLRKYDLKAIDYCSIDVEGAERAILSSFDFDAFDIDVFSIENADASESNSYEDIMKPAGYRLMSIIGADEIWTRLPGGAVDE